MVNKMIAPTNSLTMEERVKIKEALDMNLSYREIAEYVGRPKTTVCREAKRLGNYTDYDPIKAQKDFEEKATPEWRAKKVNNEQVSLK